MLIECWEKGGKYILKFLGVVYFGYVVRVGFKVFLCLWLVYGMRVRFIFFFIFNEFKL